MYVIDDHGAALVAEYSVEADGDELALIMESRSGRSQGSSHAARNSDYNRALTILLTRLGKLEAVLVDALVDSRYTQSLALEEADRRLIQTPVQLALEPDPDALRRRLGSAQSKVAQAPDASKGGNSTKRIRLRLSVPGFQSEDAGRLAHALGLPVPDDPELGSGLLLPSPAEQAEEAVREAAGKFRGRAGARDSSSTKKRSWPLKHAR